MTNIITPHTLINERNWSEDSIYFFLTEKLYNKKGNLREDFNWPLEFIEKIEATTHFSLFKNLSLKDMQEHINKFNETFNLLTQQCINDINNHPHNYSFSGTRWNEEPCYIMVDASLKKNGQEVFAGIAGALRNSQGNIILGFAQEIKNNMLSTSHLELLAIEEGINLAQDNKLTHYSIVSDCKGNVENIYKLLNNITPFTQDFFNNQIQYETIVHKLKKDSAKIIYVPREYNQVADDFSKTFYRRKADIFRLEKKDMIEKSNSILNSNHLDNIIENIYFFHPKLINKDKNHSPYSMEKNSHLLHQYDKAQDGEYTSYICPYYSPKHKQFYNFKVNMDTQQVEILSILYPQTENVIDSIILNLSSLVSNFKQEKVAILVDAGVNAQINCLIPLHPEYLDSWRKLYQNINETENIGFFLRSNILMKSIQKHFNPINNKKTFNH